MSQQSDRLSGSSLNAHEPWLHLPDLSSVQSLARQYNRSLREIVHELAADSTESGGVFCYLSSPEGEVSRAFAL